MAISFIASAQSNLSTTSTSVSLSTPSTVQDDDLLVAIVLSRSALTPPAGWTLQDSQAVASNSQVTSVFTKQASSDASKSYTWTQSSSGRLVVHYQVFRGVSSYSLTTLKKTALTWWSGGGTNVVDLSDVVPPSNDYLMIAASTNSVSQTSAPYTVWPVNPFSQKTSTDNLVDSRMYGAFGYQKGGKLTPTSWELSSSTASNNETNIGFLLFALEGDVPDGAPKVSQAATLVLAESTDQTVKTSQAAVLVLTKLGGNVQVSQAALLYLFRPRGKRVFTQIDIGNQ